MTLLKMSFLTPRRSFAKLCFPCDFLIERDKMVSTQKKALNIREKEGHTVIAGSLHWACFIASPGCAKPLGETSVDVYLMLMKYMLLDK